MVTVGTGDRRAGAGLGEVDRLSHRAKIHFRT